MATAEARRARLSLRRGRRRQNEEMRARLSAGGRWGVEGALWPGFAARGRAPAMRGQPRRPRGARILFRSATESTDSVSSVALGAA